MGSGSPAHIFLSSLVLHAFSRVVIPLISTSASPSPEVRIQSKCKRTVRPRPGIRRPYSCSAACVLPPLRLLCSVFCVLCPCLSLCLSVRHPHAATDSSSNFCDCDHIYLHTRANANTRRRVGRCLCIGTRIHAAPSGETRCQWALGEFRPLGIVMAPVGVE